MVQSRNVENGLWAIGSLHVADAFHEMTHHGKEMTHAFSGIGEGELEAKPPSAVSMHVVGDGSSATLYASVDENERFLEHGGCFHNLLREIFDAEFGTKRILKPDFLFSASEELCA